MKGRKPYHTLSSLSAKNLGALFSSKLIFSFANIYETRIALAVFFIRTVCPENFYCTNFQRVARRFSGLYRGAYITHSISMIKIFQIQSTTFAFYFFRMILFKTALFETYQLISKSVASRGSVRYCCKSRLKKQLHHRCFSGKFTKFFGIVKNSVLLSFLFSSIIIFNLPQECNQKHR